MSIKRYDFNYYEHCLDGVVDQCVDINTTSDGEWVKFLEHNRELEAKDKVIAELRVVLERWDGLYDFEDIIKWEEDKDKLLTKANN